MNRKKTFLNLAALVLIAAVFVSCNPLNKMAKRFNDISYEVTPEVLEVKGGSVTFTVNGRVPAKFFHRRAAVALQPVLEYEGGTLELRPLILRGEKVSGEGTMISYANGGSFTYTETFAFTDAMKVSELMVTSMAFVPKNPISTGMTMADVRQMPKAVTLGELKLADGIIFTSKRISVENEVRELVEVGDENPKRDAAGNIDLSAYQVKDQHAVDMLRIAPHGYEKVTIVSESAMIYYAKNLHNYNTALEWNKKENVTGQLEKLNDFVRKGWEIKDVVINGWASPEGEETFNDGLSDKRANTAANILYTNFNKLVREKNAKVTFKNAKDDLNFKLVGHGPDWNGFVKKVEASTIRDKQPILNVVKSTRPEQREEEIRNMILIFPEIEKSLLPPLRRTEITINCYEPKKTDEEIARLATTNPSELNQAELLYSATLTDDWNTKYNIYKTAAATYSNSWEAQNNAGYMALKLDKVSEAKNYFEKAEKLNQNNGMIANNIGVLHAYQGNFGEAEKHFNNANRMGIDNNYNLGLVAIHKGDFKGALSKFSGVSCNYNLALAQLLDGNANNASTNLECARKNGSTYYLMAIAGARTNNQTMMMDNLKKAIRANNAYKAEAKIDREFIKYFSNADFMAIVN
jgi:tetratricopeptide (TPR) repeat protein